MAVSEILESIDREIAQLEQVRALLTGKAASAKKRVPGRPKKSATAVKPAAAKSAAIKKRKLSPEGRKRIADAAKRRWAAHRKAAAGK